MKIAVVVASLGRPKQISQTIEILAAQHRQPDHVIISVEGANDVPSDLDHRLKVIYGPRGASSQRNRGLDIALEISDIVVFIDDDFVPSSTFLVGIERLFKGHSDVVGATGQVLADGVSRGGISFEDAIFLIKEYDRRMEAHDLEMTNIRHVYGCNMAFRSEAIHDLRFDENLPLYSWQEDVDMGARASKRGRVVRSNAFAGVHQGVVVGRTSGVRFGYSQVVNPIYLLKKGTMHPKQVMRLVTKNIIYNHFRLICPEAHIDRLGRVKGNWKGILDIILCREDPRKIVNF